MDHFDAFSIDTKTCRIEGKRWGAKRGYPIVALHGWLDNAASFDSIAPLLKKYSLYAIDLPGHGHSGHIHHTNNYHLTDAVQSVVNVVKLLHLEEFALIGHSLGGAIATLIAGAYPEMVSKLVLIDSLGPVTEADINAPGRLSESVDESLKSLNISQTKVYKDLNGAIEARCEATGLPVRAIQPIVERGIKVAEDGVTWSHDPKLNLPSAHYFSEGQVLAFLSAIRANTLLIQATNGTLTNDANTNERIGAVHSIDTYELPGKHHVHLEYPAKVGELLNEFLRT